MTSSSAMALMRPWLISSESVDQLLARLAEVDQEVFLQERKRLNLTLLDEAKAHRFRYHRPDYLG